MNSICRHRVEYANQLSRLFLSHQTEIDSARYRVEWIPRKEGEEARVFLNKKRF